MAYYITLFSPSAGCVPQETIEVALFSDYDADYRILAGKSDDWTELGLLFEEAEDDEEEADEAKVEEREAPTEDAEVDDLFARIDRCSVTSAEGAELMGLALEDASGAEPKRASEWVMNYLKEVKTIYSFGLVDIDDEEALAATWALASAIRDKVGGIIHADHEGFSNLAGDHIVWGFEERAREATPWQMALLGEAGEWTSFEIDLANPEHEKAFRAGQIPAGVTVAEKT